MLLYVLPCEADGEVARQVERIRQSHRNIAGAEVLSRTFRSVDCLNHHVFHTQRCKRATEGTEAAEGKDEASKVKAHIGDPFRVG